MRRIDADTFEQELKEKLLPLLMEKYGKEEAMKGLHFSLQDCISNIQSQPTITQPDPEWIPCSERLPIEPRHYLCSFNRPNRIDKIYVDLAYWTGGRWCGYRPDQINAWMPLPKPYKEKMNEKR